MKRIFFPASALVLVLVACGAGHASAPRVTNGGPDVRQPSVKTIAAARERVALRKAGNLLRRVALPPGASRLARPPAGNKDLSRSWLGTSVITMTADRYAIWRVRYGTLASVVLYAKRHPVPGMRWGSSGSAPGEFETVEFYAQSQRPLQRTVSVTAVAVGGLTYMRIDAGAAWMYPRSSREVVPAGVGEIDIRDKGVHVRVTDASKVARIVRWFDGLGVPPNGVHVECKLVIASSATFVFRSASGEKLASAVVPSEPADGCDPIEFDIGGKRQAPLIDTTAPTDSFVVRVGRLLGIHFPDRP
jgi:hypothetical protein